jgi:hypothetical protein
MITEWLTVTRNSDRWVVPRDVLQVRVTALPGDIVKNVVDFIELGNANLIDIPVNHLDDNANDVIGWWRTSQRIFKLVIVEIETASTATVADSGLVLQISQQRQAICWFRRPFRWLQTSVRSSWHRSHGRNLIDRLGI